MHNFKKTLPCIQYAEHGWQINREILIWFQSTSNSNSQNLTLKIFEIFLIFRARSPSPETISESNNTVNVNNLIDTNGEIQDVTSLPVPLPSEEAFPRNRIPSPISVETEELNLDYVSKEVLKVVLFLRNKNFLFL